VDLFVYTSTIIINRASQKEYHQAYFEISFNTRNFHLENQEFAAPGTYEELYETRLFLM